MTMAVSRTAVASSTGAQRWLSALLVVAMVATEAAWTLFLLVLAAHAVS